MAFKQKMVKRLTGAGAISAQRLSRETGVRQETLSKWLRAARTLPVMPDESAPRTWTVDDKIRILATASKLSGEELATYLQQEGVLLAELDEWRLALGEGRGTRTTAKRIRALERELARKEKALAEAAALLVLKKKLEDYYSEDEDDDTDEKKEP